jgi:KDO2-lipid IV(A) lauroyltransferase
MKRLRYITEYIFIWLLYVIFSALPYKKASNLGGFIGRVIGSRLAATRKAERHIKLAFPSKSDTEVKAIATEMWDNLGRVFAEYPHLDIIVEEAATSPDIHKVDILKNDGKPAICCGAHFANWELSPYIFHQNGINLLSVYRRPNNPYVAKLLQKMRGTEKMGSLEFEKSRSGMMKLFKAMKNGGHIGMLVDQKFNEGIEALFFGHAAMTSTAFVELAQKFKCPLHFGHSVRVNKTSFVSYLSDEIPVFNGDGSPREALDVINEYHAHLESWIKDHPGQWLWLHRRWKNV